MPEDSSSRGYITDKDILRFTEDGLDQGKTREEILEKLSLRHDSREYLAQIIARVPDPALKRRYRMPNQVLVILLIALELLNLVMLLAIILSGRYHWSACEGLGTPLLFMLCIPNVHRMRGASHKLLALLSLVGVLQATHLMQAYRTWALLNTALFLAIGGLSCHIGPRLFPNTTAAGSREDKGIN